MPPSFVALFHTLAHWTSAHTASTSTVLATDRFDPLNLAKDKATLLQFRAAEIKHARLAMLAAAGWPVAESWDRGLAGLVGANSPIADNGGLVHSRVVMHGGPGGRVITPTCATH